MNGRLHPDRVAGLRLAAALPRSEQVPVIAAATSGGLEVALGLAAVTGWPAAFTPALPLTPPWSSDLAYGAIAFDHSVVLDEFLVEALELSCADIREAVAISQEQLVEVALDAPLDLIASDRAILVDDGMAVALVLKAAVAALRNAGASDVVVAVDGRGTDMRRLIHDADAVYHVTGDSVLG